MWLQWSSRRKVQLCRRYSADVGHISVVRMIYILCIYLQNTPLSLNPSHLIVPVNYWTNPNLIWYIFWSYVCGHNIYLVIYILVIYLWSYIFFIYILVRMYFGHIYFGQDDFFVTFCNSSFFTSRITPNIVKQVVPGTTPCSH